MVAGMGRVDGYASRGKDSRHGDPFLAHFPHENPDLWRNIEFPKGIPPRDGLGGIQSSFTKMGVAHNAIGTFDREIYVFGEMPNAVGTFDRELYIFGEMPTKLFLGIECVPRKLFLGSSPEPTRH